MFSRGTEPVFVLAVSTGAVLSLSVLQLHGSCWGGELLAEG